LNTVSGLSKQGVFFNAACKLRDECMLLRNVGNHLTNSETSHPWRSESSITPHCKLRNSMKLLFQRQLKQKYLKYLYRCTLNFIETF